MNSAWRKEPPTVEEVKANPHWWYWCDDEEDGPPPGLITLPLIDEEGTNAIDWRGLWSPCLPPALPVPPPDVLARVEGTPEERAAEIIKGALRASGYRIYLGVGGAPFVLDVPRTFTDFLGKLGEALVAEFEKSVVTVTRGGDSQ